MNEMIKRSKNLRNRKGFTLIELIVVIVIVGILAAILIPRFSGFTDKAQSTQATVYAKQVATAIDSYYAEKNAWPTEGANAAAIETLSGVPDANTTIGANGAFSISVTVGSKTYTAGRAANGPVVTPAP